MWKLQLEAEYEKRARKWPKKYKRELRAVYSNLDTFLKALQRGQKPAMVRFGFIHPEPKGVLAIDQSGGGPHLKETRLYIYPDEASECLFVITLGDKDTQEHDIKTCNEFVEAFRKEGISKVSQEETEGDHAH
jgi:hypothetical protein